jgi:hypothetical protein
MLVQNRQIHNYGTRKAQNFHMFQQNNRGGQKSLFCDGLKLYTTTTFRQMSTSKFKKNLQIRLKKKIKLQS